MLKAVLFLSLLSVSTFAQIKLVPHKINLQNGKNFNLNLPADYEITPAAEGLKRVRFFAKAPDGRIFVTDMYDLSDNTKGKVYILSEFDLEKGKFTRVTPYLTNLKNPNSVQFYKGENGQNWIYIAETDKLTRRKFTLNETKPTDTKPQTLATFPDYGLSYKYGGWHLTRTIAFAPNGKLYVSVGSSCNACAEKEEVRASVLEMNPDGSGQHIFAKGLRNSVGLKWIGNFLFATNQGVDHLGLQKPDLKWIGNFLFATNQGVDHLGLQKPDETFYALKSGTDYGWASCYQSNGKVFRDAKYNRLKSCADVPASYGYFPAHPNIRRPFKFRTQFRQSVGTFCQNLKPMPMRALHHIAPNTDDTIKNAFLVSLHGSTNKNIGHGYKIVIMRKGENIFSYSNGNFSTFRISRREI